MLWDYGSKIKNTKSVVEEAHMSLFRAGASIVITYYFPLLVGHTKWPEQEDPQELAQKVAPYGMGPLALCNNNKKCSKEMETKETKEVAESEQSSNNEFVKVSDLNGHA